MKNASKSFALTLVFGLIGCGDVSTFDEPDVGFRCFAAGGVGAVGLNATEVTGSSLISGAFNGVFSNVEVNLVGGGHTVEGDAISGGAVNVTGGAGPDGTVIENAGRIEASDPSDDIAAAKLSNDNASIACAVKNKECLALRTGGDVRANSDVTLSTGVYYFESMTFNGTAQLHIDGEVTIYLGGEATFNGGAALNPSGNTLTIISASTDAVKINGNSDAEMLLYVPFGDVRLAGSARVKGGILANNLSISGSAELIGTVDMTAAFEVECISTPRDIPGLPD